MRIERLVMFHGTSSVFLDRIMRNGLVPDPERKLSAAMASGTGHTVSFPGVYLTASHSSAVSYARYAVGHFGGEPVVVCVSVDPSALVPDEDEVHYALGWPMTFALGYSHDADARQMLRPWSREVALETVRSFLMDDKELSDRVDHAVLAAHLDAMIGPALGKDWDRRPDLVCPDFNTEGWSSPAWVRKLTATPEGRTTYRREMDAFCRMLAGMNPNSYPAGFESCKGRLTQGARFFEPGSNGFIVAVGTPQAPACIYDGLELLDGDETVYTESNFTRFLASGRRAPAF